MTFCWIFRNIYATLRPLSHELLFVLASCPTHTHTVRQTEIYASKWRWQNDTISLHHSTLISRKNSFQISFLVHGSVFGSFSVLLEFFYWLRFIWLDTHLIKIAKLKLKTEIENRRENDSWKSNRSAQSQAHRNKKYQRKTHFTVNRSFCFYRLPQFFLHYTKEWYIFQERNAHWSAS